MCPLSLRSDLEGHPRCSTHQCGLPFHGEYSSPGWVDCVHLSVRAAMGVWVFPLWAVGSSAAVSMVCVCSQESLRAVPSGMCRRQVSIFHKTLHPVHFRVS